MEWDTGGSEQGRQEYESTDDSASFLCFESRKLFVFSKKICDVLPRNTLEYQTYHGE